MSVKRQGGLGLIDAEAQTLAIFATFITKMLRPKDPPWWAAAAFWALGKRLATLKLHPTDLLKPKPPQATYGSRPDFWKHALKSWKQNKGNLPADIGHCSVQALIGAPLEHPAISMRYDPSATQRSTLRSNGLHTLSDVFIRNPTTGAAITPASPTAKSFVVAFINSTIILQQTAIRRLLAFPRSPTNAPCGQRPESAAKVWRTIDRATDG
ncbi:hypothetical protein GGI23_004955 [Coemansia sp. RSA 2559]|nr:hypothetical protein GGI23_004955 [Coemansia sp. RSA 2559]